MKLTLSTRIIGVAALACAGGAAFGGTAAFATAQTGSAAGLTFDLGPSPVGLPASCTFANGDANFLFLDGHVVMHGTTNKNGDWGGETAEGTAVFFEGSTALFQGHLQIWGGGGNNAKGQSTNGFTLNFHGSGQSGSLSIHVNGQQTTNAAGTPTAQVQNVNISCS